MRLRAQLAGDPCEPAAARHREAAGSTIALTPLPVTPATSSSGCVNAMRSAVKAILQNPSGATVTITTAAGTLNGSLGKK